MGLQRLILAIFCCFLVFKIAGSSAYAIEPEIHLMLKNEVSLKTIEAIAFDRNPGLKAAKAKWKAVIERYPQVTALDDPEIGIDTWNIPTDFDLGETRNTIFWVSQKFPFPGKLGIKGEMASKEAEIAKFVFEMATRDLIAELKESYYELLYIDKSIKIIRQNKELAGHLAKISSTEYSKNATTLNDVLKAQSQLGQLDNDLVLLTELWIAQAAHINTLLDLAPDQPIGSPVDALFLPFNIELKELYQLAREHQHELAINGIEIEKTQRKAELAQKQYYPDFKVTLKRFENNGITQDQGYGVFFGINVPIWFEKNRAGVQEAESRLEALAFEKKDRENKTFAEINKVYFKIKNFERLVKLYKESLIPQSVQSLEIAETWYREKKGSFAGLLETRSIWLNFNLAYHRAKTDFFQNIAKMEKLLGTNLTISKSRENTK